VLDDLIKERIKKGERLKAEGEVWFPATIKRTHRLEEILKNFSALNKQKKTVTVVGRIFGSRNQGSLIFADLKDESGAIQLVLKKDGVKNFATIRDTLDIGDFVEATGKVFTTQSGQKSIEVSKLKIIVKALRPIPSERFSIEDTETRLRKRYLDLLVHPELRELFRKKSTFWQTTRRYLLKEGFLEVETPILEPIPGGAEAEPFITHHNALNKDFYLRISPELNLKRLMVAGFEKVFEIGRIFRNEGIDAEHLQDYTQMEMYWAYQNYQGLMKFVEKLVKNVVKETLGTLTTVKKGIKINWGKKWPRLEYCELFQKGTGMNLENASTHDLFKKARTLHIEHADEKLGRGRLIDLLYKKTVRPSLIQPSFLINPPVDIEPLAKRMMKNPNKVERFQIVAAGTELGKGFSELNDPTDQRHRFEEQMKLRETGDKEAQMMDEDYVEAMEYGMPPAAGFAYSERLFAILMDKPVRETVIFPLMKPKE